MKPANWFNGILAALLGLSQVPGIAAALGPYSWILGAVAIVGNGILHNVNPPPAAPK